MYNNRRDVYRSYNEAPARRRPTPPPQLNDDMAFPSLGGNSAWGEEKKPAAGGAGAAGGGQSFAELAARWQIADEVKKEREETRKMQQAIEEAEYRRLQSLRQSRLFGNTHSSEYDTYEEERTPVASAEDEGWSTVDRHRTYKPKKPQQQRVETQHREEEDTVWGGEPEHDYVDPLEKGESIW